MFEKLKYIWEEKKKESYQNAKEKRDKLELLFPIFQKYNVKQAYLFGSVARGSSRSSSDIDLYIEDVNTELYWNILRELEDTCGYDIDLYIQTDDPIFIKKIKERGMKVYEATNRISKG